MNQILRRTKIKGHFEILEGLYENRGGKGKKEKKRALVLNRR
jgi:hypothetical protein